MDRCDFTRRKPKSARTKREVELKEPLIKEAPKKTMYFHERGNEVNREVIGCISRHQNSQYAVKVPDEIAVNPFENSQPVEVAGFKNDASMFCSSFHSKKRPHNIVLGRMYNFKILDMLELGVYDIRDDKNKFTNVAPGSKPAIIFLGPEFEFPVFNRIRNILLDFYGGHPLEKCHSSAFDRVICISLKLLQEAFSYDIPSESGEVYVFPENSAALQIAHFTVRTKVQGEVCDAVLEDEPSVIEFILRRAKFANTKDFIHACKQPAALKVKGVTRDALGNVRGQVHVGHQDIETMAKRRFKRTAEDQKVISDLDVLLQEEQEGTGGGRKKRSLIPDVADI